MYGDPASEAARFRVEQEEGRTVLIDREDPEVSIEVRRYGVRFNLSCNPVNLGHSVFPESLRWLELDLVEQEPAIFVIDEAELHCLEVTHIRIVSLDEFEERHAVETDGEFPCADEETPGALAHLAGQAVGGEWLVLTVGVPEASLNELLESYRPGRMQRVSLEGRARGHTASYLCDDRPLVLFANESVLVGISGIAIHDLRAVSPEARTDDLEDTSDAPRH